MAESCLSAHKVAGVLRSLCVTMFPQTIPAGQYTHSLFMMSVKPVSYGAVLIL